MCRALSVETCGDLLPPFRHPLCTFGLAVEAGEFVGDEANGAVCDAASARASPT